MASDRSPKSCRQHLYEPLSRERSEIRLLDIETSEKYESEIRCRLRKFSLCDSAASLLNGTSSFEALSYTWGNASDLRDIIVNEQSIRVTVNLETFLRQRREADTEVALWVDAICINQDDSQEKDCQVTMMSKIYSIATSLTIWLGPSSSDSSVAMDWLYWLGDGSPYDKIPSLDHEVIDALKNLLSRPWWSRVWIVQELVCGGMGHKLDCITVQCGKDGLMWTNIVVAAVRMKARQSDLRQSFPNIDTILELDSLRDSALEFIERPNDHRNPSLDLVHRYRHFLATNPRDKLYALYNMFCKEKKKLLPTRYSTKVEQVFLDFAVDKLSSDKDLEMLRHCGPPMTGLPSWVPNWSESLGWLPLPIGIVRRYFDVPWWTEPVATGPEDEPRKFNYCQEIYSEDPVNSAHKRNIRLKRLEIGACGFGIVNDLDEIPAGFSFHKNWPPGFKEHLRKTLRQKKVAFSVFDERCEKPDSLAFSASHPDAVTQGNILAEREVKDWLVQELKDSPRAPYQAAGATSVECMVDEQDSTLKVKGIIWETAEICHDSFARELNTDWRSATQFMVSVGHCKASALAHAAAAERYPEKQLRLEAFWSTLFAGQVVHPDQFDGTEDYSERLCYGDWLPDIPPRWAASTPPVTATTTGIVEMSEGTQGGALLQAREVADRPPREGGDDAFHSTKEPNSVTFIDLEPQQWSGNELKQHKSDLEEVASLWHRQPYDLYHRPFRFLHIIPDPYWETRKYDDKLALLHTRKWRPLPIITLPEPISGDCDARDQATKDLSATISAVRKKLTEKPSIVPQGTLSAGIEKYALGRRFFITKGGRFGIGPKSMGSGDRLVVFFGSRVPFILRKYGSGTDRRGWQLIGECYVYGAMQGEVIKDWNNGMVEAGTIRIQ